MCLEQDWGVSRGCYESEAVEDKVEQLKRSPAHLRGNSNINNQGHRTRLTQICGRSSSFQMHIAKSSMPVRKAGGSKILRCERLTVLP